MELHRRSHRSFITFLSILLILFFTGAYAGEITRLSGVPSLDSLKKFYTVPNFKIGGTYEIGNESAYEFGGKGGVTLESLGGKPLRVAYIAVGEAKKDKNGKIINAVVISPYYGGDSTYDYFFWYAGQKGNAFCKGPVVGPNQLIDTDKWYVIFVDALGLWGTSKPSDGLGMKFPRYSIFDMVQANYRLLKDKLGVSKVKLATGVSMGAIQSYAWAVLHPDYVEGIMPVGGMTAADPVPRWLFQNMSAAMKSDPVWQKTKGNYYNLPKAQHPNRGMMFGWSILGQSGLAFDFRNTQPWDVVKKDVFYWEPKGDEGLKLQGKAKDFDVNDLLIRNKATSVDYNVNLYLDKIQAKTLIIHIENDQWLRYKMAEKTAKAIKGAKLVSFKSPLAHYAIFRAPNMVKADVVDFLKTLE